MRDGDRDRLHKFAAAIGLGFGGATDGRARHPWSSTVGKVGRRAFSLRPRLPAPGCGFGFGLPFGTRMFAYELCLSLVKLVAKTRVADAQLRAQARKSAASAALNCAEGAARQTRADKSRAYAIALCECCEACAAIEIAGALGACSAADVQAVVALGIRVKNILSRLVR